MLYKSRRAYIKFCLTIGIPQVPITSNNLCRYAAYLARTCRYNTIRQYLNIIRILHLEAGLSNPLRENWFLQSVLLGIKRIKGDKVIQKLPITPDILLAMKAKLTKKPFDVAFWAICLVAFFGLFRKGNLLLKTIDDFDPIKHISRDDFLVTDNGLLIRVRWSKTIQFQQRELLVPLPKLPNHPLCPVIAVLNSFLLFPPQAEGKPAPSFVITQGQFTNKLSSILSSLGYDSSRYSGHSFRRGGASWALECGLSSDVIQMLGDWRSSAYQRYLHLPLHTHIQYSKLMGVKLPS